MGSLLKLEIEEFLNDIESISPEQGKIFKTVRKVVLAQFQTFSEQIKYGGLVFFKTKTLICGIFSYRNHVSLEFSHGSSFADPLKLLQGKGKFRRHLKFDNAEDIDIEQLSFFIQQALNGPDSLQ